MEGRAQLQWPLFLRIPQNNEFAEKKLQHSMQV